MNKKHWINNLFEYSLWILALTAFLTLLLTARADQPLHTLKSHQVNEDADYVYYSDNLSDNTERTRKVPKPKPPQYPLCVTLIATNDFPVQLEYIYTELYADGRIATNHQYRTKSARERAVITLPPMPEIKQQEPAKTDALGHALKRRRAGPASSAGELAPRISKTMARTPDRLLSTTVTNDQLTHTWASGKTTTAPLKRAYTTRVKTAPIVDENGRDSAGRRPPLTAGERKFIEEHGSIIRGNY